MRHVGHVAHMEGKRGLYSILEGKPKGKRWLGRPRHGWEDNIKMNHQGVGWGACLMIATYGKLL